MINFLCGLFSGIFTGFGVGGGFFLIILLGWFNNFSQLEIQSMNLLYYIPTAIFSVWVYSKEKSIDFRVGVKFIILAVITAIIGAILAHSIDVKILKKLFAIYIIVVGAFFIRPKRKS